MAFPTHISADLKAYLAEFVAPEADVLVFTSPTGMPLRHNNFRRRVWISALAEAGLTELHFHDYADLRGMPASTRRRCSEG